MFVCFWQRRNHNPRTMTTAGMNADSRRSASWEDFSRTVLKHLVEVRVATKHGGIQKLKSAYFMEEFESFVAMPFAEWHKQNPDIGAAPEVAEFDSFNYLPQEVEYSVIETPAGEKYAHGNVLHESRYGRMISYRPDDEPWFYAKAIGEKKHLPACFYWQYMPDARVMGIYKDRVIHLARINSQKASVTVTIKGIATKIGEIEAPMMHDYLLDCCDLLAAEKMVTCFVV